VREGAPERWAALRGENGRVRITSRACAGIMGEQRIGVTSALRTTAVQALRPCASASHATGPALRKRVPLLVATGHLARLTLLLDRAKLVMLPGRVRNPRPA
jgi:hypothetical protein